MTSPSTIHLAHSPDSDDAFMFFGLASGAVDTGGIVVDQVLADIEGDTIMADPRESGSWRETFREPHEAADGRPAFATCVAATNVAEAEMIVAELPNGLTAVATISSVTDPSLASSRPRLPLSQRPYYKVLINGEQLPPKAGRADDFAWPPG